MEDRLLAGWHRTSLGFWHPLGELLRACVCWSKRHGKRSETLEPYISDWRWTMMEVFTPSKHRNTTYRLEEGFPSRKPVITHSPALYNRTWFIWISYEEKNNKTEKPLWLIFWSLQMSLDLGHLFYKLFPVTMSILHRKQTELFVLLTSSIKLMKHSAEPSLRQWRKPKVCGLVL